MSWWEGAPELYLQAFDQPPPAKSGLRVRITWLRQRLVGPTVGASLLLSRVYRDTLILILPTPRRSRGCER